MLPLLVRPKIRSFANRWKSTLQPSSQAGRDVIMVLFSLFIMWGIFYGTSESLRYLRTNVEVAYIHPSLPLGLFLASLFAMLLFSNSVATLAVLFLANDLELVLASPISAFRFFWGKFSEIAGISTWMALIFGLPALLAFGISYNMGFGFYLSSFILAVPYFLIPTAASMLAVVFFVSIVPPHKTKELFFVICLLLIVLIMLLVRLVMPSASQFQSIDEIARLLSIVTLPQAQWIPSQWMAMGIGELLEPTGKSTLWYGVLLYGVALSLGAFAFIMMRCCHFTAYSRSKSGKATSRYFGAVGSRRLQSFSMRLSPIFRAVMSKEIKIFTRDMVQAVQLILLLGICLIYLYNFKILQSVQQLPHELKGWWQNVLVICNIGLGAFITTAVCTRFVFPSVSLEGQSFWILQVSPAPLGSILRAKFITWWVPVSCISSIILGSGALAIDAPFSVVLICVLTSWAICFGIVGLAIGMGASFANFTWEHTSQLATSFGSLVFMLSSTLLIVCNLFPAGIFLYFQNIRFSSLGMHTSLWWLGTLSAVVLLLYLNFLTAKISLSLGLRALERR